MRVVDHQVADPEEQNEEATGATHSLFHTGNNNDDHHCSEMMVDRISHTMIGIKDEQMHHKLFENLQQHIHNNCMNADRESEELAECHRSTLIL